MKKSISLTSFGYKFLSSILSVAMIALTVSLIVFYKQVPWYATFFAACVAALCSFASFLCFSHRITVDRENGCLKIRMLKTTTISLADIKAIGIDFENSLDSRKYCFISIELKNGEIYKTSEYSTLFKNSAVNATRKKIKLLNEMISEAEKTS